MSDNQAESNQAVSNQVVGNRPQEDGQEADSLQVDSRQADSRPHSNLMLRWSDIDFERFTGDLLEGFARLSIANPNPDRFDLLPTELLVEIYNQLPTYDKLRLAYTYPHLFANSDRINVFYLDVLGQMRIPPHTRVGMEEEAERRPLLLAAIELGFSVDVIRNILDHYEAICRAEGIDFNILLNCSFPDKPEDISLPATPSSSDGDDDNMADDDDDEDLDRPPTHKREIWSPLHVAISHGLFDVAELLISRGANIHRVVDVLFGFEAEHRYQYQMLRTMTLIPMNPFHLALDAATNSWLNFTTIDPARDAEMRRLARRLGELTQRDVPFTAYQPDLQLASSDILSLIAGDIEEPYIVTEAHLIEMLESPEVGGIWALDRILTYSLRSRRPLPNLIRWLRAHHGYSPRYRGDTAFWFTLENLRNVENVVEVYRWDLQHGRFELRFNTMRIMQLVYQEQNFGLLQRLTQLIIGSDYDYGHQLLLWAALDVGSYTRVGQWLLEAITPYYSGRGLGPAIEGGNNDAAENNALVGNINRFLNNGAPRSDDLSLRRAIAYGNNHVVNQLLDNMHDEGLDIDGELFPPDQRYQSLIYGASRIDSRGFYGSALNTAIAERNWIDAANMLERGASPSRVRPNLRHRVRRLRSRFQRAHEFGPVLQANVPIPLGRTDNEVAEALSYVFDCMLDDPDHPVPEYARTLRYPLRDDDDPANDSENEEEPLRSIFSRQLKRDSENACAPDPNDPDIIDEL
ncbi:hypothetical protein O1611_g6985 [Lasiodiplodia mahajangana]|uniref:Uncharacterized protein n=1 Tax=Lasiodiplodia mahajangana TaxID=1108764 RepID=A0ACC2JHF4_9PEZI|nr:hypothetical protein O1611_g6985 [Lasiodiplodia mahajangana]